MHLTAISFFLFQVEHLSHLKFMIPQKCLFLAIVMILCFAPLPATVVLNINLNYVFHKCMDKTDR